MITCTQRYNADPAQIEALKVCARTWSHMAFRMGETHHGYLPPAKGPGGVAHAACNVPSLAADAGYRNPVSTDPDCARGNAHTERTGGIRRYGRSLTRPVLNAASPSGLGV